MKSSGFTIVELMVTVLIAAILMSLAVPAFRTLGQNAQQRNAVADLYNLLSHMRSESAKLHIGVTACASIDQQSCSGSARWEAGWIVFIDGTEPTYTHNGVLDAGETILQVHGPQSSGITLRAVGNQVRLTLDEEGLPASGTTFRYCDERGISSLRAVIVGPSGLVRTALDGRDHDNSAITSCT